MKNPIHVLPVGSLLLFFSLSLAPLSAPAADAAPEGEIGNLRREGIDVVQRRVFRKTMRHEFSLDGGINADNQFLMYELLEAKYTFHFREAFAFEAAYSRAIHQEKPIINDLKHIPCTPSNCPAGVPVGTLIDVLPANPPDPTQNMFFGNFIWSPIYGKFSIFSKKIYHFDIFLVAGAGMVDNERSNRFGVNVGLGTKIFLNDWVAFRLDVRNLTVREGAPFNHIINNRTMTAGVSFFFPMKPYE